MCRTRPSTCRLEAELADALGRASSRAHEAVGPFASEVARLVERNADRIAGWRDEMAVLQARCRADPGDLVLTHGEPELPNVMITDAGRLLLLDWGDLLYGPPERATPELWLTSGSTYGRSEVKRFYQVSWILGEVAEYVAALTLPHEGDAEDLRKRRETRQRLCSASSCGPRVSGRLVGARSVGASDAPPLAVLRASRAR